MVGAEPPSSPERRRNGNGFGSLQEELDYYKTAYETLEAELQEFQSSSKELEAELERDVEESEKRERKLQEKVERVGFEAEEWKVRAYSPAPPSPAPPSAMQCSAAPRRATFGLRRRCLDSRVRA